MSDAVVVEAGAERAREMYRLFLASEYPDALSMAEQVLRDEPDDFMAQAIVTECRAALATMARPTPDTIPAPSSLPTTPAISELPGVDGGADGASASIETTAAYAQMTRGYLTRQMCQRFLESDHPGALALAEEVLRENPDDRMARAIADQCRAAIEPDPSEIEVFDELEDDTEVDVG